MALGGQRRDKGGAGGEPLQDQPERRGRIERHRVRDAMAERGHQQEGPKQCQRHEAQVAQPAQRVGQFEPLPDVQQGGHRMLPAGARAAAGRG